MSVLVWFSPKQPEAKACTKKFVWEFGPREEELEGTKNKEGGKAKEPTI